MNVLILHDDVAASDRPDEQDTLTQVALVQDACAALGHETSPLAATLRLDRLDRKLRQQRPDVVFNLVESLDSRGSLIHLAPAIVESLQIPMTGAPAAAMATTSNKVAAKSVLSRAGLPTPAWVTALEEGGSIADGRWIIKSVWEHASIGLSESSIVETDSLETMRDAIESRRDSLGGEAFAERFIDGREFNVSVLEIDRNPVVLPVAEIDFSHFAPEAPRIVGYRAKWDDASFEYHHTDRRFDFDSSDTSLLEALRDLCEDSWRLFGLRGYARVDFRVDADNRPTILEINANPCLSPDAGFLAAAERAGLTPIEVVGHILDAAIRTAHIGA